MVIDKNRLQEADPYPSFGEVIYHGPRRGIYLGRYSHSQYLVKFGKRSEVVPAGLLRRTGDLDVDFYLSHAKASPEERGKVHKVMKEFKEGKLKTSSGKKVTDKDQALAIAMSEAGLSRHEIKRKGGIRLGKRIIKRNPADLALKKQERRRKALKKGLTPQSPTDDVGKTKIKNSWDTEEKVSCLVCGRLMDIDKDSSEPYKCKNCKDKSMSFIPVVHNPYVGA